MRASIILPSIALLGSAVFMLGAAKRFTPKGVTVIQNFSQQKYLGIWYEIARLDHKWERGLEKVTATYTLEKGRIKVDNKGFSPEKNKWEQSIGKAKPVKDATEGRLKVSFFGPFYSGYNIAAIDSNYTSALIIGESLDYMWILSREKTIPEAAKLRYLKKAKDFGIATEHLIWVKH